MATNGDMLRLARQRKGFHQTEAASKLGIEQSLLSRIENGFSDPREEVLLRAESVYDVPRSFFTLTDPVYGSPVSAHPMWRKKADVTIRDMDSIVAELNIRAIHLRRLLEGAEFVHANDVPRLDVEDYSHPEEIAALVRAHWKIPRGPISDLTLFAERAGIIVYHSPLGGAAVSGITFAAPGMPPLVMLNSDQPADRMRFTLAHEIGHLVMHRFPTPSMEEEANAFASALLMPASDIRPYFKGKRVDLALLAALKPEWRVAMQALLMRASGLSMITKNQSQYLWKQISMRRLRLREPPELDFPHEKPTVIESMLRVHLDALGYSLKELAQLLHVYEWDMRSLYNIGDAGHRPKFTIMK